MSVTTQERPIVKRQLVSYKPDHLTILPPGEIVAEKILEMGLGLKELADKCNLHTDQIVLLLKAELTLNDELAEQIEEITQLPKEYLLKSEETYQKDIVFHKANPNVPTVICNICANQLLADFYNP
ncbi:MAG: hypothetical protein ACRC2T_08940 [Thermoguttaceae bacterium]